MQYNCLFYRYTSAPADRLKILTVALLPNVGPAWFFVEPSNCLP